MKTKTETSGPITPETVRRHRRPRTPRAEIGSARSADGKSAMISVVADVLADAEAQQAIRLRLLAAVALMLPGDSLCVAGERTVCWLTSETGTDLLVVEVVAGLLDRAGFEVAVISEVTDAQDFEARR